MQKATTIGKKIKQIRKAFAEDIIITLQCTSDGVDILSAQQVSKQIDDDIEYEDGDDGPATLPKRNEIMARYVG